MHFLLKTTLTLLLSSAYFIHSFGQTQDKGVPISFLFQSELNTLENIDLQTMPDFDIVQIHFEDSINDYNKVGPWRFGYSFEVDYNLQNSGTWENIPGKGRVWRLKIHSENAISLNFLLENLHIPEEGRLDIYNASRRQFFGSYTNENNLGHKKLGTEITLGETAILELFEPLNQLNQSSLTISTIVHGYRSLHLYAQSMSRALNSSGDCNYDILCPEGGGWENQAKSVAMIVVNGSGACTGALVNNTANDGTPYFLTANHCGTDPSNWSFRFNWNSPTPSCAATTQSVNGPTNMQTSNGGIYKASNANSDFFLLQISNPPPASWDIYYSGWDKTDAIPDSVIGIHHPAGDVKKICKYYAQPNQVQYNAGGGTNAECWEILDWTMGVTEGGSSGSPLFDDKHRIIGQLYGGTAACDNTTTTTDNAQPDYYGRFGISWNGASSSERLKDWLDPSNTNPNFIDGFNPLTITNNNDAFAVVVQDLPLTICGSSSASPSLNIRNNGLLDLTSLDVKVDIDGTITTIPWTGNIASGDYETIPLGTLNFSDGAAISVKIYTVNPNGLLDENPLNDTIRNIISVKGSGEVVSIAIITDCKSSETGIYIENDQGIQVENIAPFGSLADGFFGNTINQDVCLVEDCYELVITDSVGDGWPSNWLCFSTPKVQVTYNSSLVVNETAFSFTTEARYPFCTGTAMVNEHILQDFNVYPNPTNDLIYIDFNSKFENNHWTIEVLDLSGRIIQHLENSNQLNLSRFSAGTYLIQLQVENQNVLIKKIIKN